MAKSQLSLAVTADDLERHLQDLKLAFIAEHYGELAQQAATKECSHIEYLGQLVEGEAHRRRDRATQNRMRLARFPVMKTRDQFRWDARAGTSGEVTPFCLELRNQVEEHLLSPATA